MGKIFYIADTHFSHANVIKFDKRPFTDVEIMDEMLIQNWNKTVTNEDTVYILGDFCWKSESRWIEILERLNGKKILIRGNHDLKNLDKSKKYFRNIMDYGEIKDDGRTVIMCHCPIPFYKKDYDDDTYMLYGHLHTTIEEDFMQEFKKIIKEKDHRGKSRNRCNFYNCWLGFYGYKPATLDEIIERWNKE